jgi:hypothetical protein
METVKRNYKVLEKYNSSIVERGVIIENTDENNYVETLINYENVVYSLPVGLWQSITKPSKKEPETKVSIPEDLFLKTLASVVNGEKYKELK